MSVRRVAMEDWVRTSVEGLGTGSRGGAPAVVPGQLAVRPGVTTSTTSRAGANAWRWHPVEIDLALFNCIFLQIFQQKWAKR
jgi:hypothetical protein